jgi:quercetin dioxygenase-like cupin family protein
MCVRGSWGKSFPAAKIFILIRAPEARWLEESMPAKQIITSIKALPGKEIAPGVTIKPMAGDHVMFNYVQFLPGGEVPLHSHHHEQIGLIIEGELEMQIGDERRTLKPGDTYVIPGGIKHSGLAGRAGALVLDAFYPLREDYLKLFA